LSQSPILFPVILSLVSLIACGGSSDSAPTITSQPSSATTVVGRPVTFEASAKGTPAPDLVWQKNGVAISSQTDTSYTIAYPKVADAGNYTLYASNTQGNATSDIATLTVLPVPTLDRPFGLVADSAGDLYVSDASRHTISKLTHNTDGTFSQSLLAGSDGIVGSADGTGSAATFNTPESLALDGSGNLYVADYDNHTIRKVTANGTVSTVAGSVGQSGSADGIGTAATFKHPMGLAFDATYTFLYVADSENHTIRRIKMDTLAVSTFAGTPGSSGSTDGSAGLFSSPNGLTVDSSGNLYVADYGNSTIRKVTSAGVVSTLAGTAGVTGTANGTGGSGHFYQPVGITLDASGNLLVADTFNHAIRKVTTAGVVTTLAGYRGVYGNEDDTGSDAYFNRPSNIWVQDGIAYVTDYRNGLIRTITSAGVVGTITSPIEE